MRISAYIYTALILFLASACSDEENGITVKADLKNARLRGVVKHHNAIIPMAKVYLKNHTSEFPGMNTFIYSDSTTSDKDGFYQFIELSVGNHYLFFVGFDSSINETVFGGIPVTIKVWGENIVADVPLTE